MTDFLLACLEAILLFALVVFACTVASCLFVW